MNTIARFAAFTLLLIALIPFDAASQKCPTAKSFRSRGNISEFSIALGATHYFGDLNAINMTNNRIIGELHKEQIKPAVSVNYRFYFSKVTNLRAGLLYTRINGSDHYNKVREDFSSPWFRQYRNLTFRSDILELSVIMELNLLGFKPGESRKLFSPFVFCGAGLIYFDPRAPYNGEWLSRQQDGIAYKHNAPPAEYYENWVRLQPLGTEGQGLPGYDEKYSLIQPVVITGLGTKFHISTVWCMTVEVGHHFSFTDYLDDISTVYPSTQDFYKYYPYEKAQMAARLSRRSFEIDPAGTYGYITAEGQQRGSPKYKDSYLTTQIAVGYSFNRDTRIARKNKMQSRVKNH